MESGHINVICRVRPRNNREVRNSDGTFESCVQVDGLSNSVMIYTKDDRKSFDFDYSADESATQQDIFDKVGIPITTRCLEGYNGTILCYGQTGSGKTYTMFGPMIPGRNQILIPTARGLVPRILEYLWANVGSGLNYTFKCSFYEIYQEKIYDLLDPENCPHSGLSVREDPNRGVYVEGCTELSVRALEDAYQALSMGYESRHVSETAMNRESSRSHAVFQLSIETNKVHNRGGVEINQTMSSRFSMVDLAGSERQRDTQTSGIRLKEASVINKSLTCLGKVINELVSQPNGQGKRRRHINYRDSKLTFLLRDSLGGNSKVF
jgi:kinesin family protein 15